MEAFRKRVCWSRYEPACNAKEIITLDVYTDNAQMIADGVAELQPFIDDVLPEEEQMYKEVTDVMVNLDFLDETLEFAGW